LKQSLKIKLDENLGSTVASLFLNAGYQATTIKEEGLAGLPDEEVIEVCENEGKILVTIDKGFSNPLLFPPSQYHGIIVLRPGHEASLAALQQLAQSVVKFLGVEPIQGKLWVVTRERIRVHQDSQEDFSRN